jgi:hypothetical protein
VANVCGSGTAYLKEFIGHIQLICTPQPLKRLFQNFFVCLLFLFFFGIYINEKQVH